MYRLNEGTFDSVATVASEKEFVYFGDVPLNFDPSAAVNSQDLQPVKRLTFGACILSRDLMIQRRHCVGENHTYTKLVKSRASISIRPLTLWHLKRS